MILHYGKKNFIKSVLKKNFNTQVLQDCIKKKK